MNVLQLAVFVLLFSFPVMSFWSHMPYETYTVSAPGALRFIFSFAENIWIWKPAWYGWKGHEGARWYRGERVWKLPYGEVRELSLEERIVR